MARATAAGDAPQRSDAMTVQRAPRAWFRLMIGLVASAWDAHDDDDEDFLDEPIGEFEFDGDLEPADGPADEGLDGGVAEE